MSWADIKDVYNGDRPYPEELSEHQVARRGVRVEGNVLLLVCAIIVRFYSGI